MGKPTRNNIKLMLLLSCFFVFLSMACPGEKMPVKGSAAAPGRTLAMNKAEILTRAASLAVPFIENAGQFDAEVKFAADLFAGRFFLTGNALVYSLSKPSDRKTGQKDRYEREAKREKSASGKGLAFREFFIDKRGAKIDLKSAGEQKTETVVSYFKGTDADKWRSNVASYQSISLGRVYPGVEVKLKASGKNVEKVFYVSPQSDVAGIRIGVSGVDGLKIAADGRLVLASGLGELAMRAPVAWQEIAGERRSVKVSYRLLGRRIYGFAVSGDYARDRALIIDPDLDILLASTFLDGSNYDYGYSLVLDSAGNVYVTGCTYSSDFPTTAGAYDQIYNEVDVFVSKLNGNLTALLASTLIGGNEYDSGVCLALDSAGDVVVAGATKSTNFPTTAGAYNRAFTGDDFYANIFVSKLDSGLSRLLASTLIGGSYGVDVSFMALDGQGNVYLTGGTRSPDFPTTGGAFDRTCSSIWGDAFVSKFDSGLTSLLAGTFLGTGSYDIGYSLALDGSGDVYVTGGTRSPDFPTTAGAYSRTFNSSNDPDAFVSKFNSDLTTLLASTFLGGNSFDWGRSLALDNLGNVYLGGNTGSSDFPTTPGAYDRAYNEGLDDAFVSCLDSDLTRLISSTFLGGHGDDGGILLALDVSGNVYLAGETQSTDFPTTARGYNRGINGEDDIFVSEMNSSLGTLLASTYLGGSKLDYCRSLVLSDSGNVYLTGTTHSINFPTTGEAYTGEYTDDYGTAFVSLLNGSLSVSVDLEAERREARAFSILRHYGQIQFTADNSGIPVAQYLLMRREDGGEFVSIWTFAPSELQDNQFQMQDKYLEKDTTYTYRVEAYNAAGQLVGISTEKTI